MLENRFKEVKNFEKYMACTNGHIYSQDYNHTGKTKALKEYIDKDGYPYVKFVINAKAYKKMVHRVIAETLIPNPLQKPQVNHKNGIKMDMKEKLQKEQEKLINLIGKTQVNIVAFQRQINWAYEKLQHVEFELEKIEKENINNDTIKTISKRNC